MKQHSIIGRTFRAFGAIYRCTSWERGNGFWMEMIGGEDKLLGNRQIGYRANVSERAIHHTYWRYEVVGGKDLDKHDDGCNCWICEGREEP